MSSLKRATLRKVVCGVESIFQGIYEGPTDSHDSLLVLNLFLLIIPSVLQHCWLGGTKDTRPLINECWHVGRW